MPIEADRLAPVAAELGEGTTWWPETGEILWVDILRGEVHAVDAGGTDRIVQRHDEPVGAVALTADGEILASTPRGLVRSSGEVVAAIPRDSADLRMNDGKPDPAGRFVGGTMTLGDARVGAGTLWSLDGGVSAARLVEEVTIPNGLAWSADGETLYWIDTPSGRIDAFDYDVDRGTLSGRRPHVVVDPSHGSPDGMCIDADGGLWVAMWGGGAVRHYDGAVCDAVVEVPTPLVTCPAFVGPQLDRLAITTASIEFDDPPAGAGDLYVADAGVVGAPVGRLGSWASS